MSLGPYGTGGHRSASAGVHTATARVAASRIDENRFMTRWLLRDVSLGAGKGGRWSWELPSRREDDQARFCPPDRETVLDGCVAAERGEGPPPRPRHPPASGAKSKRLGCPRSGDLGSALVTPTKTSAFLVQAQKGERTA